jgi:hypothetical protein
MSQGTANRRDAEPDRVHLLKVKVVAGLILGMMSLCAVLPCVVGLPLSVAGFVMAARDRARMDAGLMDMRARGKLDGIVKLRPVAVGLNLVGLLAGALVVAPLFLKR